MQFLFGMPGNARMEGKVSLDMLHNNEELEFQKSFHTIDHAGRERTFAIFTTKKWE